MKVSFLWDSDGIDFVEPLALPRANGHKETENQL